MEQEAELRARAKEEMRRPWSEEEAKQVEAERGGSRGEGKNKMQSQALEYLIDIYKCVIERPRKALESKVLNMYLEKRNDPSPPSSRPTWFFTTCTAALHLSASKTTFCAFLWSKISYPSTACDRGITLSDMKLQSMSANSL
ncbi:MAG: hypothetical protein Q9159_007022 [Coniocarpon cinnabarinum]